MEEPTITGSIEDAGKSEAVLERRIKHLQFQLSEAKSVLRQLRTSEGIITQNPLDIAAEPALLDQDAGMDGGPPPGKTGYLFKWQDRTIGWGGTKWALRFVSLERGRLLYYVSHADPEARYELPLIGCGVCDDGWKQNKRHKPLDSSTSAPPINEDGAYFHVFSIYQRDDSLPRVSTSQKAGGNPNGKEIVPILRFSTPSLTEKNQWVSLISESCAYCDTEEFIMEEKQAQLMKQRQKDQQLAMARAMPQAERGTLPPLYFAPAPASGGLKRTPSGTKLPRQHYLTKSFNTDAEKVDARSTKGYPPSKPMHREAAPSYLSEEAPVQNYRGILNLAGIILVVSNARLLIDTFRHHGYFWTLLPSFSSFANSRDRWVEFPLITGFVVLLGFVLNTFFIEWLLSRKKLGNFWGGILHQVNSQACLATATMIVWRYIDNPAEGAILLFHGVIAWMKLISYALANEDYRTTEDVDLHQATLALVKDLDDGASKITYPENVTLPNLLYFIAAPTLTYQIAFPRSPRVRLWKVAGILFRMSVVAALLLFLTAQVISPNLRSLAKDLEATGGDFTWDILAAYALRLSIANMYCWLLVFYGYFHLCLNLAAELLRFGDRVFYKDWWNSSEVSAYWRLWNTPVHYWLVRHVYFPCVRMGCSRIMATFVVFFLSAVVHELLISVPFHMVRPWAYLGMMMQVPLVIVTKALTRRLPGTSISNIIFWVAFFIGQPLCVLLYTIDYQFGKYREKSAWTIDLGDFVCISRVWGQNCSGSDEL